MRLVLEARSGIPRASSSQPRDGCALSNPAYAQSIGVPTRLAVGQGLKVPRFAQSNLSPKAGVEPAHWFPRSRDNDARLGYT